MHEHGEVSMSRVPILVILGATGSGKSRLGIELAQKFCTEIVSADSMQVYKGLDIVTAKVTHQERNQVVHHLLDIIEPMFKFSVIDFRDAALPIMDDLLACKKMPIVVGGTNYYIESLLWKVLVADPERNIAKTDETENKSFSPSKRMKIENSGRVFQETNEELYHRLTQVDPEMARRLHPNNRRKVIRSLEVFEQHGVTHSEILKKQRLAGGCGLGGPLRYPNIIIFWLHCEQKVLDDRINRRVDEMIVSGLIDELLDFHRRYNKQRIELNRSPDYTKGIFQTIGFKEFHDYLILPEEERKDEKGQELLQQSIDNFKLVTRRYARKQNRWVLNRLIRRKDRQVPPIYTLDCTDVTQWNCRVLDLAIAITNAVMEGTEPEQKPINETIENKMSDSSNEEPHYCETCERLFIGELQWNAHLKSFKHQKVLMRKARKNTELTVAVNTNNRSH